MRSFLYHLAPHSILSIPQSLHYWLLLVRRTLFPMYLLMKLSHWFQIHSHLPPPNDPYFDYSIENCILHPWIPVTSCSPHIVYFSFLFFHGTFHFLNRIANDLLITVIAWCLSPHPNSECKLHEHRDLCLFAHFMVYLKQLAQCLDICSNTHLLSDQINE